MGQPVAVVEKPSTTPGVVRLELNRSLTGMGHEHFRSPTDAIGPRPAAELARRLFATDRVDAVHAYSNMVTVELRTGADAAGFTDIVRDLYKYWLPGVEPPTFDDPPADDTDSGSGSSDAGGEADAELSEAAKRVPGHLLERSRVARERWKAKQGG
ncbi:MAG: hypothetical protein WD225_04975 [Ilumatobacteraceae bacterium]